MESYGSGWEVFKDDTLAKKIIESDEFTSNEKLKLIRALDNKNTDPWVKDTSDAFPYTGPAVIIQSRGYDDGCEERRYKLTC